MVHSQRHVCLLLSVQLFNLVYVTASNQTENTLTEDRVTETTDYLCNITTSIPCVPYAIDKFPNDFLTEQQRLNGGLIIYFLIAFYLSSVSAIISEHYCVPALELTIHYFNIPSDVGSAIILPISTSSVELFSCLIGAFITHNNVGIGTVIGTSAFNLLIFTTFSAFSLKKKVVPVDWYPITRDSVLFCCSIAIVICFLMDGRIAWWEAAILSTAFVIYVTIICLNKKMESFIKNNIPSLNVLYSYSNTTDEVDNVCDNLLTNFGRAFIDILWMKPVANLQIQEPPEESPSNFRMPTQNIGSQVWWILMCPANILLSLTIPNCKRRKFRKLFPITFIISIIWIAGTSYISVWMATIIGYTLQIPVAVGGIIVLAVGASIPQIVFGATGRRTISADVIIAHQLQSNIFGVLLCLGIPWLIRCLVVEKDKMIVVNDQTIIYTFVTLLSAIVIFWILLLSIHWKLSWKFGLVCLVIFATLIIFICLYQLNIIGKFSAPLCRNAF